MEEFDMTTLKVGDKVIIANGKIKIVHDIKIEDTGENIYFKVKFCKQYAHGETYFINGKCSIFGEIFDIISKTTELTQYEKDKLALENSLKEYHEHNNLPLWKRILKTLFGK